jgi:hypothetical protein
MLEIWSRQAILRRDYATQKFQAKCFFDSGLAIICTQTIINVNFILFAIQQKPEDGGIQKYGYLEHVQDLVIR